ncbi:WYL domain-containing protein [Candidatus Enterococcus ferrettii]|uniref:WYL domain-containing protein n=1 Tax=Candidatus Enterococcus ferrettii TaxID=2815324 RepID=A0ABV0EKV5_9ENTE|nr:WYL domain-containing protein [Enterococcus sp. 665A]
MAKKFQELVKQFSTLRSYTREFLIYGFKSREEITLSSPRTYDNERRRLESLLQDYVEVQTVNNKKIYRLVLPANQADNPLHCLWQTKSFTRNDIFLHFVLLDILASQKKLTVNELVQQVDSYLEVFKDDYLIDSLTIRNKLNEYAELGILSKAKEGKQWFYSLEEEINFTPQQLRAIQFYKETAPMGVIGDLLLKRISPPDSPFCFKHKYDSQTLDSELLLTLLQAIKQQQRVQLTKVNGVELSLTPLKVYSSCESGRQYLVGIHSGKLYSLRLDYLEKGRLLGKAENYQQGLDKLAAAEKTAWNCSFTMTRTVNYRILLHLPEPYLYQRLLREKRQGSVTPLGDSLYEFSIDLIDPKGMEPWLRTWIGRIVQINSPNRTWENQFWKDVSAMNHLYGLEE